MKKILFFLLLPLISYSQDKIDYLREPDFIQFTDSLQDGQIRISLMPTDNIYLELNRLLEVYYSQYNQLNAEIEPLLERKKKLEKTLDRIDFLKRKF